MNKLKLLVLLILILFSIFIPNVKNSSGIGVSGNQFIFYIDKAQTINFEEMKFSVFNEGDEAFTAVCKYQNFEGIDFRVDFIWENITVQPQESIVNRYTITVNDNIGATIPIVINCRTQIIDVDGESQTSSAVNLLNYVKFYSEDQASLLEINIIDQSRSPRYANVIVHYRENNTLPWSPFLEFTGSREISFFPNGFYEVIATDLQTNVVGKSSFELNENMEIDVVVQLMYYSIFKLLTTEYNDRIDRLGVEIELITKPDNITNAEIQGLLFFNGDLFSQTTSEKRSTSLTLWFDPFKWIDGNYSVVLRVQSNGINLLLDTIGFSYFENKQEQAGTIKFYHYVIIFVTTILILEIIRRKRSLRP